MSFSDLIQFLIAVIALANLFYKIGKDNGTKKK